MGRQGRKFDTWLKWTFNSLIQWYLPTVFCGFIPFLFYLITIFLFLLCNFSLIHLVSNKPETQDSCVASLPSKTNSNMDLITMTTLENIFICLLGVQKECIPAQGTPLASLISL